MNADEVIACFSWPVEKYVEASPGSLHPKLVAMTTLSAWLNPGQPWEWFAQMGRILLPALSSFQPFDERKIVILRRLGVEFDGVEERFFIRT